MGDKKVTVDYWTLTERLAQVERTAAANLRNYKELLEAAERELAELRQYSTMRDKDLRTAREHAEMRSEEATKAERERDTARQMETMWRGREHTAIAERDAALARAAAAERALGDGVRNPRAMAAKLQGMLAELNTLRESEAYNLAGWKAAEDELTDMKERIEALADDWESGAVAKESVWRVMATELRALLTPSKAETAIDVLARIEKRAGAVWDKDEDLVRDDLAKLRALLESSPPAK